MVCANCGLTLEERGCKVRCARCGYFEDCSDPSAPGDWAGLAEEAAPAARAGGATEVRDESPARKL